MYTHLNVTSNLYLIDLDRFRLTKSLKTGNTDLLFLDSNKHWQSLTNKRTGEFLAAKTSGEKFGGLNIMKSVLSLDETPSALQRSFKAAAKLRRELSLPTNRSSGPPSTDKGTLKKWLDRQADALKRRAEKAVEVLPTIVESFVGAILSFLEKPLGLWLSIHGP